jgi:hypothetical protein
MSCAVRRFDLGAVLPPHAYDIDEISIVGEQRCEVIHIVPIPSIGKGSRGILRFADHQAHLKSPLLCAKHMGLRPDRDERGGRFQTDPLPPAERA